MKKMFEKHTIAKIVGIVLLLTLILTWILPSGVFQGSQYYKYGMNRIGFNDIPTIFYNSVYFALDKIIFILVLGGFYTVLSKTNGYNKLVSNIVKKIKGKEILFTLITSVVFTALTSFTSNTFALLLFVPFVITILLNAGLNKLTAFASTFGAMLVGVLGATYGADAFIAFNSYFSQSLTNKTGAEATLVYRVIILVISTILYNFFLYFGSKKALTNKKKEEIVDEFKIADAGKKKVKVLPIGIALGVLTIVFILGFIDWAGIFNLNIFTDFHNWLMGIKLGKDFTIVSYLFGTQPVGFGAFDLLTLSIIVAIFTILISVLYSVKFDELLSSFGEGAAKLVKPIGALVGVYAVFIIVYMSPIVPTIVNKIMNKDSAPTVNIDYKGAGVAIFNYDSDEDGKADFNKINQDTNKDGKCDLNCDTDKDGYPDKYLDFNADGVSDEKDEAIAKQFTGVSVKNLDTDNDGIADVNISNNFSLVRALTASVVTNILHVDLGYTGYVFGPYLSSNFGSSMALVFLVFFAIYALLQFVIPTSLLLVFGLTYLKVGYKDWLKYIWRFALGMLCVLLIIFIFLAI